MIQLKPGVKLKEGISIKQPDTNRSLQQRAKDAIEVKRTMLAAISKKIS